MSPNLEEYAVDRSTGPKLEPLEAGREQNNQPIILFEEPDAQRREVTCPNASVKW